MKKLFKTLAAVAMVAMSGSLASCSGESGDGGSDAESMLFGKVPSIMMKIEKVQQEIKLERKTATTQKELIKAEEKEQKMKDEWIPKLEEAAQALDGKQLDISEGDFKVTTPLTLTY
ncbi:MAG: hypothetical protein K2F87_05010, partial [Muribaculaceae bacterium]|nr:hypothetical protein [Muribaculaceae bacterium]